MQAVTFKQFLLLERRTEPVSFKQAVSFIEQYCKRYVQNRQWIYRGTSSTDQYMYGNSFETARQSRFAPNHGTKVLDNIQSWQTFPKRSQSYVCSSSVDYAEEYGNPYLVFIPDQTEVGILDGEDLHLPDSFPYLDDQTGMTVDHFSVILQNLGDKIGTKTKASEASSSFEALVYYLQQAIQIVDKQTHKKQSLDNETLQLLQFLKQYGVQNGLNELFDPQKNNIQLVQASNLPHLPNNEVWFSGPAVFAKVDNEEKPPEQLARKLL